MKTKLSLLAALLVLCLPVSAQTKHAMLGVAFGQTATGPTATISWTQPVVAVGETVSLYRCAGTPCTALTSFTLLAAGISVAGPYVDTTVIAGPYAYYAVNVVNGFPSAASNIATGTLSPPAPTGLTVTISQ
jgi:hypothetical protein